MDHEVGVAQVDRREQHAHCVELGELVTIDVEHALHEGKLVCGVFLPVLVDLLFEKLCFVADLETIRKISVLLKPDLLGHGAIEKRSRIAMGDLGPQTCVFTHVSALENLI